ncbi:MAG: YtxH domain-containing protein [Bacillota bacterium]|nr:YtxH domain-containing protein [Bacillota bacterium]
MGKSCSTILGIGLAGAIIGMHAYMLLAPDNKCELKDDINDAVKDLKKAVADIVESV